jgi:hypothetical protein
MVRLSVLAVATAVLCVLVAAPASGAPLIGKDGTVHACYKLRGKAKGSVRLVAKKAKCRKGEKKVAWSAAGQRGSAGENGESGAGGNAGEGGGPGANGVAGLESRISALTSKVNALEGVLKGISNGDLTGLLSKLQGVSGTQLQEAVRNIASVSALCTQAKALTEQSNVVGGALAGISLINALPGLGLSIPTVPSLSAFSCP